MQQRRIYMPNKKVIKLPVEDRHNGFESFIPLGILEGRESGPTLAVIGGVHASEYVAQDGVARFWESLDPEQISGRVLVVLAADVTALCAHHIYTNPIDGKNLNRTFPGKRDGTLAEVIAYELTEKVISKADAVIDCHGGEFDEYMALYLITSTVGDPEVDRGILDMAMALGVPFIEVGDMNMPAYPWLGRGTADGEALLMGKPGMAIEAGERGIRDKRATAAVVNALQNGLKHLGIMPGTPVPWAGKPVILERGIAIKSTAAGIFEPEVMVGDWIDEGDVFALVREFDGTLLEEIRAPVEGTVLTVISARAIKADGFAGKMGVVRW
jgi:predicted deacylase